MRSQEVAFTLWIYYNQPLPVSRETLLSMEDSGTVSLQLAFDVSGSEIVFDYFQSITTFSVPFTDVQNKWHFLGIYREGAVGGYVYDGAESISPNFFTVLPSPTFTLHIGAEAGGANPYLGAMSRFSIFEREVAG